MKKKLLDEILFSQVNNNNSLCVVRSPKLNLGIVSLWYKAGSITAPQGMAGLPHLFEHLFLIKTKSFPNKVKHFQWLEKNAFIYNAYTSKELVNYHILCEPGNEIRALEHLLKCEAETIIQPDDIIEEIKAVADEERRNSKSPSRFIKRLADSQTWINHKYGLDIYGSIGELKSLTHNNVSDYRSKYYDPSNRSIICISPIKLDVNQIQSLLSNTPTTSNTSNENIANMHTKSLVYQTNKNTSSSVNIALTYKFNSLDFNNRMLSLFVRFILTGGWSGFLVNQLRVKNNFTYWVRGETNNFIESSYMRFYYSTERKQLSESLKSIDSLFENLATKSISPGDLNAFKHLYNVKSINYISDPYEKIIYYSQFIGLNELFITKDVALQTIERFTPLDIKKFIRTYLTHDNLTTTII